MLRHGSEAQDLLVRRRQRWKERVFRRISLVLCVDTFRCLQLSPCCGTARLVRSSKHHGMKWRFLEARRKVQY